MDNSAAPFSRRALSLVACAALVGLTTLTNVEAQQPQPPEKYRVALVARDGSRTELGTIPGTAFAPRLSPDGKRVAYDTADGKVWIAALDALASPRQLPSDVQIRFPGWSPDGQWVYYTSPPTGEQSVFRQKADGSAPGEMLFKGRGAEIWSARPPVITFLIRNETDYDVWYYSLETRETRALAAKPKVSEMASHFSPDGRWIAFQSDDSGRHEIYVEPFPATGERFQLTTQGGQRPLWSKDGREIFFDDGSQQLFVMSVETAGGKVKAGNPKPLPIQGFVQGPLRRQYDLMPDGRFLMLFQ